MFELPGSPKHHTRDSELVGPEGGQAEPLFESFEDDTEFTEEVARRFL